MTISFITQRQYFPLAEITEMIHKQYALHLVQGDTGHILTLLKFQARYFGIELDRGRISSYLPGSWTVTDFEQANNKAKNCRKRARRAGYKGDCFTGHEYLQLLEAQGNRCARCGGLHPWVSLSADHIVPLSQGGSGGIENLQILCENFCHPFKEFLTDRFGAPVDYRQAVQNA